MAYLFKEQFHIFELANLAPRKKLLIFEPEEYLAGLYALYLQDDFQVSHCQAFEQVKPSILNFNPHVLVYNIDHDSAVRALLDLKTAFPRLLLFSTGLSANKLKELMEAGVIGHINRKFSRPQDLAVIVKSVLF